jgi:hypothetical protein
MYPNHIEKPGGARIDSSAVYEGWDAGVQKSLRRKDLNSSGKRVWVEGRLL